MDGKTLECNKDNVFLLFEIFPELEEWVDEKVSDITNFIEDEREKENENL